jgi:tetratricopeptide (TPR) repeat protein
MSADILSLAAATLAARIAAARGDSKQAITEWRRAVELEARVQYDEPPAWFYPVRQSLGAMLLRSGRPREAEAVFRETLTKHPRDGRLLFGLWQSLLAQQRDGEARLVEAQFRDAWKGATVPLTLEDLQSSNWENTDDVVKEKSASVSVNRKSVRYIRDSDSRAFG